MTLTFGLRAATDLHLISGNTLGPGRPGEVAVLVDGLKLGHAGLCLRSSGCWRRLHHSNINAAAHDVVSDSHLEAHGSWTGLHESVQFCSLWLDLLAAQSHVCTRCCAGMQTWGLCCDRQLDVPHCQGPKVRQGAACGSTTGFQQLMARLKHSAQPHSLQHRDKEGAPAALPGQRRQVARSE